MMQEQTMTMKTRKDTSADRTVDWEQLH